MKISTSTDYLFRRVGMEKGMRMYAEAGFGAIDYGMFHLTPDGEVFTKYSASEFKEYFDNVRRTAHDCGIEVYQCHAPFPLKVFDEEKDPMLLDCAIKSIYAAAHLDCPYIVIHPVIHPSYVHGQNYDECRRVNFEFYGAMVPALRDTGVVMCIENMFARDPETDKRVPTTVSKVEWMIDFIDSLNDIHGGNLFAACLDTGHAVISGSGPSHMQRELGHRTAILHVQDNDGLVDMHQIPGRGKINWSEFVSALRDTGYSGTFNFEADSFYEQWDSDVYGEEVLQEACRMMYTVGRALADKIR
ncbi:MAG: sugar phosphate isomerase/epimerase [Firmicutes bacterium]|nr:sugar phosphate isomerase/epimerase [Bacillota bacterium]